MHHSLMKCATGVTRCITSFRFCRYLQKLLILAVCLPILGTESKAQQIITVIAGTSTTVYNNDGGPATDAYLNYPQGIAYDKNGNLYIADMLHAIVRKVTPAGIISTVAGNNTQGYTGDGGPATDGAMVFPNALAVDKSGNLFIADWGHACVRKVDTFGIITTVAGTGSSTTPYAGDGTVATNAPINNPSGITVDTLGNLYIADAGYNCVRKVSASGIMTTVAGSASGTSGFSGDSGPATSATLNTPNAITFDRYGNLYISDSYNNRIRKVGTDGIISTIAGNGDMFDSGDDGPATDAGIALAEGMTVDNEGNIYISDYNIIRKINAEGIITTYIPGSASLSSSSQLYEGTYPIDSPVLYFAYGLAIDNSGNLTIVDDRFSTSDYFVRKVYPASVHFMRGKSQSVTGCQALVAHSSYTPLDSLLKAYAGYPFPSGTVYSIAAAPVHGELSGISTDSVSVGDTIVTSGALYYPSAGYAGTDSFKIRVTDGSIYDTTTIYITINASHAAIVAPATVFCAGATATFSDTLAGGTWSSSGIQAAVNSSTGALTASFVGAATISYTFTCGISQGYATKAVTINPVPVINGYKPLITGGSTVLSANISGGTWSSANTAVATISSTGTVSAIATGYANISYTVATGCSSYITEHILSDTPGNAMVIIAGSGSSVIGYSGDGGPATAAQMTTPHTPVFDSHGNLYVSEEYGGSIGRVRKITPEGIITTYAGGGTTIGSDGGPATAARLYDVRGIAIDQSDNLYLACAGDFSVRKVNTDGIISTVVGITGSGAWSFTGEGQPATATPMPDPFAVAVDDSGNIYVSMAQNDARVCKVNTAGIITTIVNSSGVRGYSGDGGPATAAKVSNPWGLAFDKQGNLYVSDLDSNVVRKVNTAGIISTVVGNKTSGYSGDGGPATAASIYWPTGMVFDGAGNMYLAAGVVRKITPDGIISTIAGGGTWMYSDFQYIYPALGAKSPLIDAMGVALDRADNLYVADWEFNAVRKVFPTITRFDSGTIQHITVPQNDTAFHINTNLSSTIDTNVVKDITWSVISGPAHGTLNGLPGMRYANYTAPLSYYIGAYPTTTNVSYKPDSGYVGMDSFIIKVSNIADSAITKVYASVYSSSLSPITGVTQLCDGTTTTLSDATAGGTWSSSLSSVATVSTSSGIVTGITDGTATITYTISGSYTTTVVTVSPYPSAGTITGTTSLGTGTTVTLTDAVAGGTWSSSNTSIALVNVSTGVVTSVAPGTAAISYSIATVCGTVVTTRVVTVSAAASVITGTLSVCTGNTTALSDATSGGSWISSNTAIATVNASTGVVTGVASGTATISYNVSGSYATAVVTVNAAASAGTITGSSSVTTGSSMTLSDAVAGGSWISSNTAIATVNASTGVVTGVGAGTTVISYSVTNSCGTAVATKIVTVNAISVSAITGALSVCSGSTTTLSDATTGGSWISSNTAIASVNASTGVVTGTSAGTATISYTVSGSYTTAIVTVNAAASAGVISGSSSVASGSSITLSETVSGGTWISSNISVASVNASTGVLTGVGAGTTVISYSVTNGCGTAVATKIVTVSAVSVSAITGTLSVCPGSTTTLTDATTGGTWSSSNISIATVNASTGVVTGVSAGTTTISYNISGGYATAVATIIPAASAGTISGASAVTVGSSITLSDAISGGVWSSSSATANVSGGVVTGVGAGTTVISYSVTNSCGTAVATKTININSSISGGISGTTFICAGTTTALSSGSVGGTWSSNIPGRATVDASSGVVTGVSAGTVTISYSLSGSYVTAIVTVNALPSAIAGTASSCSGTSFTLTDGTTGGTWSSDNLAIASVGASTGVVTGVSGGTATISYTLGTGCAVTKIATINASAAAITSGSSICIGATTTLADATIGGTWSSANTTVSVYSASGAVTGISAGTATISYTLAGGCRATAVVTVSALPGTISGTASVCPGLTTTLTDATAGGTWGTTGTVAAIGSTGIVTGITSGTAIITYTSAAGCSRTVTVTVNTSPAAIGGSTAVCPGSTTTLTDATTPLTSWTSSSTAVATIGATTGIVTGVSAGMATITYKLTTGCITTAVVTVNALPPAISGTLKACVGMTTSLGDATSGGVWSASNAGTVTASTIDAITGVVTGLAAGQTYITYSLGAGCRKTATVTINATPGGITGTAVACVGTTTTLADVSLGGTWASGNTGIATINISNGIVTGVAAETTTVTYTLSGCSNTAVITVNPVPSAITGAATLPIGGSITLSNTIAGGAWSSQNSAIATVGGLSGVVTGVATGTVSISYSFGGACKVGKVVTVTPASRLAGSTETTTDATNSITIYPNPNKAVFTVQATFADIAEDMATVEVVDMAGHVVYRQQAVIENGVLSHNVTLDGKLTSGMYLLNVRSASSVQTLHFVVEK